MPTPTASDRPDFLEVHDAVVASFTVLEESSAVLRFAHLCAYRASRAGARTWIRCEFTNEIGEGAALVSSPLKGRARSVSPRVESQCAKMRSSSRQPAMVAFDDTTS